MRAMDGSSADRQLGNPVDEARTAIWRLFQEGYVDEDMATNRLVAVDLGTRRTHRNNSNPDGRDDADQDEP